MALMPEVEKIMAVVRRLVLDALASGKLKDLDRDVERIVEAGVKQVWPDMDRSAYQVRFTGSAYGNEMANLQFAVDHHHGSGVTVHQVSFEIPWHRGG